PWQRPAHSCESGRVARANTFLAVGQPVTPNASPCMLQINGLAPLATEETLVFIEWTQRNVSAVAASILSPYCAFDRNAEHDALECGRRCIAAALYYVEVTQLIRSVPMSRSR